MILHVNRSIKKFEEQEKYAYGLKIASRGSRDGYLVETLDNGSTWKQVLRISADVFWMQISQVCQTQ